jgi:hypothetical protein
MVKCKVFSGTLFAAVLAGMVVPSIDVCPAEFGALKVLPDPYIFEKPEDAGQLDGKADASDFVIVFGQNLDLALAKQTKRPFPCDDVYRLIARVQNKCMFHSSIPIE